MKRSERDLIEERIDAGIELLDENIPNWRERIDLTQLDLRSTYHCVLGEVFAEEFDPERYVSPFDWGMEVLNVYEPAKFGFDIDGLTYEDLTERWKVRLEGHVDYPHHPGFLHDCPGCMARCHCEEDSATCVWQPTVEEYRSGLEDRDPTGRHAVEMEAVFGQRTTE